METPYWLAFLGSYLTISYGIYRLFEKAGDLVVESSKKKAYSWLINLKVKEVESNWPPYFIELFDKVYTKKHISWKCFFRSVISSMLFFLITFSIVMVIFKIPFRSQSSTYMNVGVLLVLLYNILPDYFSLLQTRYLIKKMTQIKTWRIRLGILLLDLVLTYLIFVLFIFFSIDVIMDLIFFKRIMWSYRSMVVHIGVL